MTRSPEPTIEPGPEPATQPGVRIDGGPAERPGSTGIDPAAVAELRRQLLVERERSLNAIDRVLGAQAEAAQARAEIKELQYRLHVREAELGAATELLAERSETGGPKADRLTRSVAERAVAAFGPVVGRLRPR